MPPHLQVAASACLKSVANPLAANLGRAQPKTDRFPARLPIEASLPCFGRMASRLEAVRKYEKEVLAFQIPGSLIRRLH
jgi:hypothetical protein